MSDTCWSNSCSAEVLSAAGKDLVPKNWHLCHRDGCGVMAVLLSTIHCHTLGVAFQDLIYQRKSDLNRTWGLAYTVHVRIKKSVSILLIFPPLVYSVLKKGRDSL